MGKLLEKEMDRLERRLLDLSAMVEENLLLAVKTLGSTDRRTAQAIIDGDHAVDLMEVDLEEECLKLLALHQPVAADLRVIVALLKVNNDLERIGDLAVTISRCALSLAVLARVEIPAKLNQLAEGVRKNFSRALDGFIGLDTVLAREVCRQDKTIDRIYNELHENLKNMMRKRPEQLDQALHLLRAARALERVGDHATNIAEDVIYMQEGDIVRHTL